MKSFLRSSKPAQPRPELTRIELQGGLRHAVYALSAGLELLSSDWPAREEADSAVYESGVRLARGIVDATLRSPSAPSDRALADEARAHLQRVTELAREYEVESFPPDGYEPESDVLAEAGAALREQALEHHDAEFQVAIDNETGARLVLTMPVTVEQAHVWLLGSLYEKAESWVREDPLTTLERLACAWWLSRWRGSRPLRGDEFAHGVREQEFTFVDRPLRCTGEVVMQHLLDDGSARFMGPRQRHMAKQLLESEAGLWMVESRVHGEAVFVAPLDGARYRVREHASMEDNPYGPGFLSVGRLIPFGDGTWLRSPGSFLMSYGDDSARLARSLAEGMRSQIELLPGPAIIEGMVHTLSGIRGLPRSVPPAPTPDLAAEVGRELMQLLRERGIATPADPTSDVARRLGRHGDGVLGYEVDIVLAEFIEAVFKQSQKSRAMREVKRRRDRQARKKKGKRR